MFVKLFANFKMSSAKIVDSLYYSEKQPVEKLSDDNSLSKLTAKDMQQTNKCLPVDSNKLAEENSRGGDLFITSNSSSDIYFCDWANADGTPDWEVSSGCLDADTIVDKFARVAYLESSYIAAVRRNDREEIRRRLATGDQDDYQNPGRKKPSLQSRLQSGMNLQICFMNDVMSDTESPSECPPRSLPVTSLAGSPLHQIASPTSPGHQPSSLNTSSLQPVTAVSGVEDFSLKCMRLQAEARLALAQAKDVARAHMQRDKRRHTSSPITEMLRHSLSKVGVTLGEGRRRVSRQILTDMNIAQLQVIVNDMHSQIELLNEGLVKYLMERDELHMSQDSMLVDIEDLTRYLSVGCEREPAEDGNCTELHEQQQ